MAVKKTKKGEFDFFYNTTTKKVTIRWTCPLAKTLVELRGCGCRYKEKTLLVLQEHGEAFKTAKARVEKELIAIAKEEIQKAEVEAKQWRLQNDPAARNEKVYAAEYLRNMREDKLCGTANEDTRYAARKYVTAFADWIAANLGEKFELHQINKDHCEEWLRYLEAEKNYSFASISTMKRMVQYPFDRIEEIFEKAPYAYRNPFKKISMKKCGLKNTVTERKENFTIEQLEYILKRAGENRQHNKKMKLHTFAFFYFLMVTGWREGDVAGLKWDEIDLKKRVIRKLFKKTKNSSGMVCKLYITPLMLGILEKVKELPAPKKWSEYVFCYGREDTADLIGSNVTKAQTHIRTMRKELGLTQKNEKNGVYAMNPYAVHSIRGTVTSLLKGAGNFNNDLVEFILGHVGDTVSQTSYERFDGNPELYTREPLEFMEAMIEAEKCFICNIYPPELAQSRLDNEMPSGWKTKLLVNFWEQKAVDLLENYFYTLKKSRSRTGAKQVNDIINRANEMRSCTGLPKVTDALVRSLLPINEPQK